MSRSSLDAVLAGLMKVPERYRRKFVRLASAPRKRRKSGEHSREELLDFMRRNNIRSPRKLDLFRSEGEPIPHSYRKEFGSWGAATREAFGPAFIKPSLDKEYIAKCGLMAGVKNYYGYLDVRRRNPDIFPSAYRLIKAFGSFREFMIAVKGARFGDCLKDYLVLTRKLGKTPTLGDCGKAGLIIEGLTSTVFDDKKGLDSWVKRAEKTRRKNER